MFEDQIQEEVLPILGKIVTEHPQITLFIITYEGYGDSGDIDSVEAYVGDHLLEETPNEEALKDVVYSVLSHLHGGWEINEGSKGTITVDLLEMNLTVEHDCFSEDWEELEPTAVTDAISEDEVETLYKLLTKADVLEFKANLYADMSMASAESFSGLEDKEETQLDEIFDKMRDHGASICDNFSHVAVAINVPEKKIGITPYQFERTSTDSHDTIKLKELEEFKKKRQEGVHSEAAVALESKLELS